MDIIPPQPALIQRRTVLKHLATGASLTGMLGHPVWAQPNANNDNDTRDAWRAMSRIGYGPSPGLISALQAAPDARTWARAQVDMAFAASQTQPSISPDLAHFNTPLPQLFEGVVRERQVRAQNRSEPLADVNAEANRRLDFSSPLDPAYFNRAVQLETAAWRLGSCSRPDEENPLLARMTEFWFNHLNVFVGKGQVRPFTGHYLINVARAHALGKFEDLLLASARHPAMLYYLDQVQSVAEGSPGPQGRTRGLNENYARELLELHTLGVHGGYQQADVRALARVLTGWTVGPNEASGFRFALRLHDTGRKTVMGQTYPSNLFAGGEQEGVEAIRLLARHPATAQRVCLRLARYFVADQPPHELVARLSQLFLATQGDLRAVMKLLLQAPEFWQPEHRLFKTPMDFACSALTIRHALTPTLLPTGTEMGTSPPDRRPLTLALGFLAGAGQPLHGWQTPDGYPFDAATWLVPEALTRRADFALNLMRQAPELTFLDPFLSAATRAALSRERPALRAGLALASPDFMYK
jgi:uncharacterized protein (DUF1800 family)